VDWDAEELLAWVEVAVADNSLVASSPWEWATVDLADPATYEGGFKEARLLELEDLIRGLSDDKGEWSTSSFGFTVADADYLLRARLASSTTHLLQNRLVTVKAIDEAGRLANSPAATLATGVVRGFRPDGRLRFTFKCADAVSPLVAWPTEITIPRRVIDVARFPDAPTDALGGPEPIVYGHLAHSLVGAVPTRYLGTETIGGQTWRRLLVAGHAVASIAHWYFDPVVGNSLSVIEIDSGEATDFIVPGRAGWVSYFGATPYRDVAGRRYTFVYARGPKGDALAAGTARLMLDVVGVEATGDSAGSPLLDGFQQYEHFLRVFGMQDYQAGAYPAAPTFAPLAASTSRIDTAAFDACRSLGHTRLAGGYVGAGVIGAAGERATLREWTARFNRSLDADLGFNAAWQLTLSMVDVSSTARAAAVAYDDVLDVEAGTFEVEPLVDEFATDQPYAYERDFRENRWLQDNLSLIDHAALVAVNSVSAPAAKRELWLVRSSSVAANVCAHVLSRKRNVPTRVRFTVPMRGAAQQPGDLVHLTHFEGVGATGYADRLLRIRRQRLMPLRRRVAVECDDAEWYLSAPVDEILVTTTPRARVHAGTAQTLTTGSSTPLGFDTESFDYGGLHQVAVANTRLSIPPNGTGTYVVIGQVSWTGNATGTRTAAIRKNGTTVLARDVARPVAVAHTQQVSWTGILLAGEWVELLAEQTSGGALATIAGDAAFTGFQCVKLPGVALPDPGATEAFPRLHAYRAVGQVLTSGTAYPLAWDRTVWDTGAMLQTYPTRLLVPRNAAGVYWIGGRLSWAPSAAGVRKAHIYRNGARVAIDEVPPKTATEYITHGVQATLELAAGDVIELFAEQTSGGDLGLLCGDPSFTAIQMVRLF
jgi:hypothetical protein